LNCWTPVISSGTKLEACAWEAIDAISQSIWKHDYPSPKLHVYPFHAYDEALLYGHYGIAKNDISWVNRAIEKLNSSIDSVANLRGVLSLHGGLCGLAWTAEHLAALIREHNRGANAGHEQFLADIGDEDLNVEVDAVLLRRLRRDRWEDQYDLISGLVGFGVYFLERLPRETAVEGLRLIIYHLERISEPLGDGGITWLSPAELLPDWQRESFPEGLYNLGVAHGIPGIAYLLGESHAAGIEEERTWRLLAGLMKWLWANQRDSGSPSRFAAHIAKGVSVDSRMAWCYGDLGILAVLFQVGSRPGCEEWLDCAHELLEHCLARSEETLGISDMALCHGAAGVAHIFNRIYQQRGDARCLRMALTWYERMLMMRKPEEGGVAGCFSTIRPEREGPVIKEATPGFLSGAIGVALTLLAALTPTAPLWDRLMLISGKPALNAAR
jgi:class I lanthipeptide synthase